MVAEIEHGGDVGHASWQVLRRFSLMSRRVKEERERRVSLNLDCVKLCCKRSLCPHHREEVSASIWKGKKNRESLVGTVECS